MDFLSNFALVTTRQIQNVTFFITSFFPRILWGFQETLLKCLLFIKLNLKNVLKNNLKDVYKFI